MRVLKTKVCVRTSFYTSHPLIYLTSLGISMRRVVDDKCEVIINSEISNTNKGPR